MESKPKETERVPQVEREKLLAIILVCLLAD